jgi:uncharacterized protein YbbC (DUF1343 family)
LAAVTATGLDRLLAAPGSLKGRRYGLLAHGASVTAELRPAHLALVSAGAPPTVLFGPEHGYHAVEQDMVPSEDQRDPWTGLPIRSLYGASKGTLRPGSGAFEGLDLLIVDLQDVGARYYTYAATAVWAAQVAVESGCQVWVLDRPNPLGGEVVEGNLRGEGLESFVGAFPTPVRHGLTLGELVRWQLGARQGEDFLQVWQLAGWERRMHWPDTGLPWVAPSPNMPCYDTAAVYPGLCLLEATSLSEGRGTTRPFRLVGSPEVEPLELWHALDALGLPGLGFLPCYFRPQFQKHTGDLCCGVEVVVTDPRSVRSYAAGVRLLEVLWRQVGGEGFWRAEPYEFVADRPAIDLLAGSEVLRRRLEAGQDLGPWIASWELDVAAFREQREAWLLYR